MNANAFNRDLRKSLNQAAKEVLSGLSGEIQVDELLDKLLAHEFIEQIDPQIIKEAAARSVLDAEIGKLTKAVPPNREAPNQTLALFDDQWKEHGQRHEQTFVKNRHATREHNKKRMKNVATNAERVNASLNYEEQRYTALEIAYQSDSEIENNEQAVEWLLVHKEIALDL